MKLTDWYEPFQKPVRIGVYMTETPIRYTGQVFHRYSYWDGEFWYLPCGYVLAAQELGKMKYGKSKPLRWCGLKKGNP